MRRPRRLSELYADPEVMRDYEYGIYPMTVRDHTSLFFAAPKVGKSFWTTSYGACRALGEPFIGQDLDASDVLIVCPDEGQRRVAKRLKEIGVGPSAPVHVTDEPAPISQIAAWADELEAGIVIVDTLARVAGIKDENDNAGWIDYFNREVDPHVRESDAEWILTHHDRKGGGTYGSGIRGASSLYGCVDIAFSLKRVDGQRTRRRLTIEGTRLDDADDQIIEFRDGRYELVGSGSKVALEDDDTAQTIRESLTDEWLTVTQVAATNDIARGTADRLLKKMHGAGMIAGTGEGGQRDPRRYRSLPTCPDPRGVGRWARSDEPTSLELVQRVNAAAETIEAELSPGPGRRGDATALRRPAPAPITNERM